MTELKDRLIELLEESDFTINRIASEINKSPSTISRICSGESKSSKHTIDLLASYFGVSERWLATGLGEKYDNFSGASGTQDNKNLRENLVKNDLIQKLDVIHFKGNIFVRTPFNKFLLLVPVLDEMAQEEILLNPNKPIPIDDYNRHPISVNSPTSGDFVAFEIVPDYSLNRLLAWDILEKDALVVGREIKRGLWNGKFYFHAHKLYIIIHDTGIFVREIISQPIDNKFKIKTFIKGTEFIEEEIDLDDCARLYSVVSVCHNM